MDDTPAINDGADTSLRKTVSLLNKIEAKTGSTTITGPVTVSNEVEVKNDSGNPVPVNDAGGSLTVDGSVSVSNLPASYPVTDNGGSLTVDGTVGISGTVPVSGTFWQSTQPVSDAGGSLTIDGLVGLDGSIPSTPFYTFTTSTTFPSSWITPAVDVSSYSEIVLFITGQSGASGLIGFQGEYVVGSGNYVSMSYSRISANHSVTFYPNGSTNAANGFNIATIGFGKLFTAGFKTLRLNALSSVSGTWTVSLYGRKISPIEPGHPLFGLDAQKLNHFVFSNNRLQVEASQVGTYAVSGTVNVNNSIAANLKTQAQLLDSSGNQLTYAATGTAGTPASDVVTVQGIASGTAVAIRPRHAAVSVVTGSTANTSSNSVLSQNTTRQYLLFQNLSDTDMNINFGAAASSSTMLIPKNGGGIVFETGFVPTDAVNLICTAASKAYYILHA